MLQFYYDFLDKHLDRADFQMCEMDTDSAYIAISGDSVESLVKPELREEFQQDKCNWFPRTDTREHKAYDKRTPGARFSKLPVITGPVKLLCFPFQMGV